MVSYTFVTKYVTYNIIYEMIHHDFVTYVFILEAYVINVSRGEEEKL